MQGRLPKPREDRIREGKKQALPLPVVISGKLGVAEVMDAPAHLSQDATAWWMQIVPALAQASVIERVDLPLCEMTAEAYGDFRAADRVLKAKGPFAPGSKGQAILAPWMKMRRDSLNSYERLAQHLAVSPVGRARLGLAHLAGQAMAIELEKALGSDERSDLLEGEVVQDMIDVGLPGL